MASGTINNLPSSIIITKAGQIMRGPWQKHNNTIINNPREDNCT